MQVILSEFSTHVFKKSAVENLVPWDFRLGFQSTFSNVPCWRCLCFHGVLLQNQLPGFCLHLPEGILSHSIIYSILFCLIRDSTTGEGGKKRKHRSLLIADYMEMQHVCEDDDPDSPCSIWFLFKYTVRIKILRIYFIEFN